MDNSDKQLLKEIQADIKKDQILKFLRKYVRQIIVVLVAILLLGITYGAYVTYINLKAEKNSFVFYDIKEKVLQGENSNALQMLDALIKDGTSGYVFLAYMEKAKLFLEDAKPDEAVQILKEAQKEVSLPSYYIDMIQSIQFSIRANLDNDEALIEDVKKSLNKKSAYYYFDLELYGSLLVKNAQYQEAFDTFNQISTAENVPSNVLERAKRIKSLLNGYLQ